MAYLNRIELIGNLGADPEEFVTASGKVVLKMSLATTKRYTGPDGERKAQTEWHSLAAFGRTAETLKSLRICKGQAMFVSGEMHYSQFTRKDGSKGTSAEVRVEEFQLLSPGRAAPAATGRYESVIEAKKAFEAGRGQARPEPEADDLEDLPF